MPCLIAAISLLTTSACAEESRAREIDCQRRLVEIADGPRPVSQSGPDPFARWSVAFREMSPAGCTDGQRHQAEMLARVTADLAAATSKLTPEQVEGRPELAQSQAFLELDALMRQFDGRRRVIRRELEEMTADAQ